MITNYISTDIIFEKINSEKIPGTYWNDSEITEWIYDALIKLKMDKLFKDKVLKLDIVEGKVKFPENIISINKVEIQSSDSDVKLEIHQDINSNGTNSDNYIINNGYLYTEYSSGFIHLNYRTVVTDKNDNLLVPDNDLIIDAIVAFIQFKLGKRAYFSSKLDINKFTYLQQDWYFKQTSTITAEKESIYKNEAAFRSIHNRHMVQ